MRVPVALAVFELFHQRGRRIAKMQRHGLCHIVMRILSGTGVRLVHGVAFGRRRQVNRCLRQRGVALGHPDEMDRVFCGHGDGQRLRIGVADVFRGEPDETAGDIERIFAGLHHARQPVDGGVRIAVPHRFVQSGNQVVVLLSRLVVEQSPPLNRLLDERGVHQAAAIDERRRGDGQLEKIQRHAGIAVRVQRYRAKRVGGDLHRSTAQAAFRVVKRARQDRRDLVDREPAKDEDFGPGQESRVHLERGVFGRRADEDDIAGLDTRQKRVLLRLVEAVDFVDEDDRAAPGRLTEALGVGHDVANLFDAREHRAEGHESRFGRVGNNPGERRLARARRSPEDDGLQQIALDRFAQRLAGRQQLFLTHEFVERAGAHALGERSRRVSSRRSVFGKQGIHGARGSKVLGF